jgi:hypothetical protein
MVEVSWVGGKVTKTFAGTGFLVAERRHLMGELRDFLLNCSCVGVLQCGQRFVQWRHSDGFDAREGVGNHIVLTGNMFDVCRVTSAT